MRSPSYAYAFNQLGYVLLRNGEFTESLKAFAKAQELNPKISFPIHNAAEVYCILEDLDQCRKFAEKGAKWARTNSEKQFSHLTFAFLEILSGSLEKAEELVDRSLKIRENHPASLVTKGIVLNLNGQYAASMDAFERALKISPNYFEGEGKKGRHLLRGVYLASEQQHRANIDVLLALTRDESRS